VNPKPPIPSFPRKREPRDFSHLPPVQASGRLWAPAFAGATIGECCQFDNSRLRGDDKQGGVPHADFRDEVLGYDAFTSPLFRHFEDEFVCDSQRNDPRALGLHLVQSGIK
jgi:hypothetical protein